MKSSSQGSGGAVLMGVIITAIALVGAVGPWFAPESWGLSGGTKLIFVGVGAILALAGIALMAIGKFYRKTASDEAFVKTGMGGQKVIINGGALVIDMFHEIIPVSLSTMRIDIERKGSDALITGDKLRADCLAEFYIKVNPSPEDVNQAATSLGDKATNRDAIKELVKEKLISALRTVAATKELYELNEKRDEFAEAVMQNVTKDLKENGLTLESVTVSQLDQTDPGAMNAESNVFDAEGAKRIAEIVQTNRVARNMAERTADEQVKAQDVSTAEKLAELEVKKTQAEQASQAEQAKATAEAEQAARTAAAEQGQIAGEKEAESQRAIEVARVEAQQAIEVENQRREQAVAVAAAEKDRADRVAKEEASIAVAEAEQRRATAEAEMQLAKAAEEKARQEVKTVEVTETAEREKQKAIIDQQAASERTKIEENMGVDVKAYEVQKLADAEREAAEAKAEAIRTEATASRDAEVARAEGDRAVQLIPVEVEKARVAVRADEVAVEKDWLEAQAANEAIARELKVQLADIEKEQAIGIAAAESMGKALSAADMTIFGDPQSFRSMTAAFNGGLQFGQFFEGLEQQMPEPIKALAGGALAGGSNAIASMIKKFTGQNVTPEQAVAIADSLDDDQKAAIAQAVMAVMTGSSSDDSAGGSGGKGKGTKKRTSRKAAAGDGAGNEGSADTDQSDA